MDVLKVDILYSLEVSLDILAMVGTSILLATTLQVKTGAQVGGGRALGARAFIFWPRTCL